MRVGPRGCAGACYRARPRHRETNALIGTRPSSGRGNGGRRTGDHRDTSSENDFELRSKLPLTVHPKGRVGLASDATPSKILHRRSSTPPRNAFESIGKNLLLDSSPGGRLVSRDIARSSHAPGGVRPRTPRRGNGPPVPRFLRRTLPNGRDRTVPRINYPSVLNRLRSSDSNSARCVAPGRRGPRVILPLSRRS